MLFVFFVPLQYANLQYVSILKQLVCFAETSLISMGINVDGFQAHWKSHQALNQPDFRRSVRFWLCHCCQLSIQIQITNSEDDIIPAQPIGKQINIVLIKSKIIFFHIPKFYFAITNLILLFNDNYCKVNADRLLYTCRGRYKKDNYFSRFLFYHWFYIIRLIKISLHSVPTQ